MIGPRVALCGRCRAPAGTDECWYCQASLCDACWETPSHCGHPEAEAANEEGRRFRGLTSAPAADVTKDAP